MIENAVTDLPLPDSPTSPSVSPLRDLERHIVDGDDAVRPAVSKIVVRFSTDEQRLHVSRG